MGSISEKEFKLLIKTYKIILLNIKSICSIGEFIGCIMMLGAYINLFFFKIDKVTNKYCFGAGVVRNDSNSEGIVAVCDLRNIFAHFTDINRAINTFELYKEFISNFNDNNYDTVINDTLLMLKEFDNSKIDKLLDSIRNNINNSDSAYVSGLEALSNMSSLAANTVNKKG